MESLVRELLKTIRITRLYKRISKHPARLFLLLLLMLLLVGISLLDGQNDEESAEADLYKVIRVVDGDTIELEGGITVRYIGVDTPESVKVGSEVECFGKEAAEKNRELVEGKMVSLEKDISETDRFGRLLRYVYIGDQMVNEILVKEGYANVATFPPDVKYQKVFADAENEARESGRGLWDMCSPE